MPRCEHFGPAERERKQDRVPCRHVGDRDAGLDAIRGNVDRAIGERRAAELREVDLDDPMLGRTVARCDPLRRGKLGAVALAVVDREAKALEAFAARPRERGRRIEPAGKKNDCALQRLGPCARRCFALAAAGVPGYFASSASSVFCAPRRSPSASCEVAMLSIASGALASSGQLASSFCCAAIACL